jgi:hypothetical protein
MHCRRLAFLLLAPALAAQNYLTSPAGFLASEAQGSLLLTTTYRLQQIDATIGRAASFQSLALRRDRDGGGPLSGQGVTAATLQVGHGTWGTPRNDWQNWLGQPTFVFAARTVGLPDWRAAPPSAPAAFDFVVPFQAPWSYNGNDAFVFELQLYGGSQWVANADRHFIVEGLGWPAAPFGTGCQASGQSARYSSRVMTQNHPQFGGIRFDVTGGAAPPRAPAIVLFDAADRNLAVAGLCARLHVLPVVQLLVGVADQGGFLPRLFVPVGNAPWLVGQTLYAQLASPDGNQPGIPLALSNGAAATVPPYLRCVLLLPMQPPFTQAEIHHGNGLIARLQY